MVTEFFAEFCCLWNNYFYLIYNFGLIYVVMGCGCYNVVWRKSSFAENWNGLKKFYSERRSHFCGIGLMVLERLRDCFYEMKSFEVVYLMSYGRVVYMVMVILVVCF